MTSGSEANSFTSRPGAAVRVKVPAGEADAAAAVGPLVRPHHGVRLPRLGADVRVAAVGTVGPRQRFGAGDSREDRRSVGRMTAGGKPHVVVPLIEQGEWSH